MSLSGPNRYWIEKVILELGDEYHITVQLTTAISTGTLAVVGALIGGYTGGKWWHAALGAAVGGATEFALASLREMWSTIRDELEDLIEVVSNYLRRIDPADYARAFKIIMDCTTSKRELVYIIIEFLIEKLGRIVTSSLPSA